MDNVSFGPRRAGAPSRRGQSRRPQAGRSVDPAQSAEERNIYTFDNGLQDLHASSASRNERHRIMDTPGSTFCPQDARSSMNPRVMSDESVMSRRERGSGRRHEDPAFFNQGRPDGMGNTNSTGPDSLVGRTNGNSGGRRSRGRRHPRNVGFLASNRSEAMDPAQASAEFRSGNVCEPASVQSTSSLQDQRVESTSRASDVQNLRSLQAAGPKYDKQHPHRSSRRQQWRPACFDRAGAGHNDEPCNEGLHPQDVETSKGAVDEVLQSLSIHRTGRRASSKVPDAYGLGNNGKHLRVRSETVSQMNKFVQARRDNGNVPQLVQELEEKLRKGLVECMICYDMVRREAAVWSCGGCFAIFHIACIRKWARAPISADLSVASSSEASVGNWRCPGCQSPQIMRADDIKYRCFCGEMAEPPIDFYLTPHSCGGPCKKALRSAKSPHCQHVCTMQCHPGPCLPCNAVAPPQFCPCGKNSYTQRCSDLKAVKSCGQICGHQLDCGRHYCQKVCHEGPCGSCDTLVTVNCFCGRRRETMACGGMSLQGAVDWENGMFSCGGPCPSKLQCGKHSCSKRCHPGHCGECELAPGIVWTCPCGKASVQELLGPGKRRERCTDPVPRCGQICEKLLPCGKHACQSLCHVGDCPPCEVLVDQKCRCKSSSETMPCYKAKALDRNVTETMGRESPSILFLCNRTCGKKKNCGRHRCSNRCCPLAGDDCVLLIGEEDPHLCSLPCGKKLRCGLHTCDELCHNGYCPPCLGSTFTELSCACGRTSIPPPVPCGTLPPSCPHPCSRPQSCGHAATHQCHFGECPPCIVLTAKECVGGHVVLRNVPCGSKDIKCNKLCGKARQCRLHACARLCHLPPCEEIVDIGDGKVASCGQQCGAPRRECQHVCIAACHPGSACPEARCKFPVTIACACGRLTQQVPCDAGESSKGIDMLELAYISSLPLQPVDGKTRIPLGQRKLACDEECAKLEKKRVLAEAFGMTGVPADLALSSECVLATSEALRELLIRDPQWVLGIEDRFKFLLLGPKSNFTTIRVHVFGFLPMEKREIIKQLAERWHFTTNAVGREPKVFLTVHVNSKSRVPNSRMLFGKTALPPLGQAAAPAFNPSLDMDPRFVVGLFELPREADISSLVLRFGGECELVWLNDKNALAVFFDMTRAACAIRRVDHASAYAGAVRLSFTTAAPTDKGWATGETTATSKTLSRRKNMQESKWSEDAWGEEWARVEAKTSFDTKAPPISMSVNPWEPLEHDDGVSKTSAQVVSKPVIAETTMQCTEHPTTIGAADNWEDLDS